MALNLDGLKNLTKNYGQHQSGIPSVEYNKNVVQSLRLDEVKPDPTQPRLNFEEEALRALSESIVENGLLQPIVVRKTDDGYLIVAGERRYRASQMAGLETIRAIVTEESDETKIAYLQLVENMQRADLGVSEIAEFITGRLAKESVRELAKKLSMNPGTISKYAQWRDYPEELKQAVKGGKINGIRIAYEFFQIFTKLPEAALQLLASSEKVSLADIRKLQAVGLKTSKITDSKTAKPCLQKDEGQSICKPSKRTPEDSLNKVATSSTNKKQVISAELAKQETLKVVVSVHGESGWLVMRPSDKTGIFVEFADGSVRMVDPSCIQLVGVW